MWELLFRKNETKERLVELWRMETDMGTLFKSLTTYVDPSSNYVKIAETSMDFIPEIGIQPSTTWDWIEQTNCQTPPGVHGVDIKVEIVSRIALANSHFLYRSLSEYRDPANNQIKNADEAIKATTPNDGGVTSLQLQTILAQYLQYSTETHYLMDNGLYANLQAAVDAADVGDVIAVGATPDSMSNWGDAILKPGITIMGVGAPNNEQCKVGKLTFAPTTGATADNCITIGNVQIDSGINTPCLLVAGTAGVTVRVNGVTIRRDNGTSPMLSVMNSVSDSAMAMNSCLIRNYGTSTGVGVLCGMANFRINNSIITKCSVQCAGGLMQISHSQIEFLNLSANDSLIVTAGQMTVSHSAVRNLGVGSNGANISTGAILGFVDSIWDLADLTGYVVKGTGNIVIDRWVFTDIPGNPRNTNVQSTINIMTLNNTPNIIA